MQSEGNKLTDTENLGENGGEGDVLSSEEMMRMVMKMANVSTISLLLLCCTAVYPTDSQDCNQFAATGDNTTVHLNHKLDNSEKLQWNHGEKTILNKRPDGIVHQEVNFYENGSLKLTDLKKSDAGIYTPKVYNKAGKLVDNLSITHLCVLGRVQKPKVKTECPSPSVKFTCQVAEAEGQNIEWLRNEKVLVKANAATLTQAAQQVEKDSFSCKVSNRVSSETSEPVIQTCLKPKPFLPDKIFGINSWIIVGCGGGFVVVLIIIVIVCCVRTKRKKHMRMKDEGELRLAWTNEQQQHHHHHHQHNHPPDQHPHHHRHHPQQPAGHTGPRQHRPKQPRPRAPETPNGQPQPSPRRPAQAPKPADKGDEEKPPPLPQPRKKAGRAQRV